MGWPRFVLRNLRQRPGRTAFSVVAVAIGVAVFLSVSIGTRSLSAAVEGRTGVSLTENAVALVPTGVFNAVAPASAVDPIRGLPDVLYAEGSYSTPASIEVGTGQTADGTPVPELIVPITLASFRSPSLLEGRLPAPGAAEVVVGAAVAAQAPVEVGSTVVVRTPVGPQRAVITGLLQPTAGQSLVALTSSQTLGQWTGTGAVVNSVIVGLAAHVDPQDWVETHRGDLGPFQPAGGLSQGDAVRFFDAIDDSLAPLAGSSLFVAGYLILLSIGRSVQDRATTTATLRALGTSRGKLVGLVLAEAAAIGVAGTIIGYGFGSVLGRGVTAVLRQVFDLTVADAVATVPASVVVTAAVLGLATPVLAALLPALAAGRVDPAAHLRGEMAREAPPSATRLVVGAALFAGATLATIPVDPETRRVTATVALAGAALALPVATRPIGNAVARAWSKVRPGPGEVAAHEMARRPGRSGQTSALLATVLTATFLLATLAASQRPEFIRIIDHHYGATVDLHGNNGAPFPEEVIAEVAADPGVAAISAGARGTVTVTGAGNRSEPLTVIDPETFDDVAGLPWAPGTDGDAAMAGLRSGEVALATAVARRVGVDVGDQVTLQTLDGPSRFRVAGTYHGLAWGETVSVTMGTTLAAAAFGLRGPSVLHVDLRPDVDVAAWSASQQGFFAQPLDAVRADLLDQFDGITNIAVVLLVVTAVVGVLGLGNTLAMDILDRRREIGVLRALGAQRRDIRSMVVAQALILTAVAGVLAVVLGTLLGAASVTGTGQESLGIPISFRYPVRAVPLILSAALVAGALAAVHPARRASRMEPTEAVRLPAEA